MGLDFPQGQRIYRPSSKPRALARAHGPLAPRPCHPVKGRLALSIRLRGEAPCSRGRLCRDLPGRTIRAGPTPRPGAGMRGSRGDRRSVRAGEGPRMTVAPIATAALATVLLLAGYWLRGRVRVL